MGVPFVTWLGGKRRLLKSLLPLVPKEYNRYYEPFVGGGALFHKLEPEVAIIGDANAHLMTAYWGIRNNPEEVARILSEIPDNKLEFERRKDMLLHGENDPLVLAATFVYLNKTCFAGVWNCRKDGRLSTPYDLTSYINRPHRVEAAAKLVLDAGPLMQRTSIRDGDWKQCVADAEAGDFVFFDPPYLPADYELKGDGYRGYTKAGFSLEQQEELAQWVHDAHSRGIHVIATNTDCTKARELYDGFPMLVHATQRSCSSHSKSNQPTVGELIVNATQQTK